MINEARKGHKVFYANHMEMLNIDIARMLENGMPPASNMSFKRNGQMFARLERRLFGRKV